LIDATPFLIGDAHGESDRITKMEHGTQAFSEPKSAI